MKTAIVITDNGTKQVMLTPENEHEREVLKWITDGELKVEMNKGSFTDNADRFGMEVYHCRGGYLRANTSADSLMFTITPKPNDNHN